MQVSCKCWDFVAEQFVVLKALERMSLRVASECAAVPQNAACTTTPGIKPKNIRKKTRNIEFLQPP